MGKKTKNRLVFNAFILGLIWALPGLLLLPDSNGITQAFTITMASGMISGGAIALYPIPAAALSFSGTIILGHLLGFSLSGNPNFVPFAIVTVTFIFVIMRSVVRHEQIFVAEFRARRELAEKKLIIETLLDQTRIDALVQQQETEAKLAQAQKMEAIGTLTSGVAHDFNNLLAVIMGNIELAQADLNDPNQKELLASALKASERGAELTSRLLAFSRKAPLLPAVVDVADVIGAMEPLLTRTMPSKISATFAYGTEPCFAKIDRSQLENAVLNLVINACDAMQSGGQLSIETRVANLPEVHATADGVHTSSSKTVQIVVSDTGSGIPENIVEKVFEPFFTTKQVGDGSGLGLAMIYGFAKQSGGSVELSSTEGYGTSVTLFFPWVSQAEAIVPRPVEIPSTQTKFSGRALVVEDNEAVRKVVVSQLTQLGFKTDAAASGDVAHKMLKAGERFDLVVTDFSMPGYLQGSTLARVIANDYPETRVIMMSGYPRDAFEELRSLTSTTPCLTKPVQFKELKRAIQGVLLHHSETSETK